MAGSTVHDRKDHVPAAIGSVLRYAFLAFAVAAAGLLFIRQRAEITAALGQISLGAFALSLLLCVGYLALSFVTWRIMLSGCGTRLSTPMLARMFFLGQLGKYAPGGIWSFVGVAAFGKGSGLDRQTVIASLALALVVSLAVAAAIGLATVPQAIGLFPAQGGIWAVAGLALITLLLHPRVRAAALRLARVDLDPAPWTLARSVVALAAMWGFAGAHAFVLAGAAGADMGGFQGLMSITGIYAVAWAAGFLFVIAPAGLGAREAILVALLSVHMPLPQAMVVALLSRVGMTLADFLLAGIAGLIGRPQAAR